MAASKLASVFSGNAAEAWDIALVLGYPYHTFYSRLCVPSTLRIHLQGYLASSSFGAECLPGRALGWFMTGRRRQGRESKKRGEKMVPPQGPGRFIVRRISSEG